MVYNLLSFNQEFKIDVWNDIIFIILQLTWIFIFTVLYSYKHL